MCGMGIGCVRWDVSWDFGIWVCGMGLGLWKQNGCYVGWDLGVWDRIGVVGWDGMGCVCSVWEMRYFGMGCGLWDGTWSTGGERVCGKGMGWDGMNERAFVFSGKCGICGVREWLFPKLDIYLYHTDPTQPTHNNGSARRI